MKVFKAIKTLLGKLEKFSEDPEAAAKQEKQEGEQCSLQPRVMQLLTGVVLAAATSWTGWAVSSLTSKFYKSGGRTRGRGRGETNAGVTSQAESGTAVSSTTSGGAVETAAQEIGSGGKREGGGEGKNEEEGWDEDEWEVNFLM